jgi:putative hemolysin
MLPPLLLSYINAGAKVIGKPAFDQDFNCLDFLTILKLQDLRSSFKKRYFKNG